MSYTLLSVLSVMYKKIMLWMMSVFVVGCVSAQSLDTSYQSVVQVMSYDAIYGKYPVLRGRWSAAIVSSDGVLLTNSHVVSQENGKAMATFAICMSNSISSRPSCKYTASLIKKDEQKDIALLRIDAIDIDWWKVDFSKFVPLQLDSVYVPKAQDKTLAIGYPSVGADTITQTVGVVAGTQQYNESTYIKTDAAISPGNSWWPLLKDGKIIWVNTFTMGNGSSLWYALLVSQAQEFIDENVAELWQEATISMSDFQTYLKRADRIQIEEKVSDNVFSFSFSKPYVITNYIPNTQLHGTLQNPDSVNVESFALSLKNVLPIKSLDDFIYILKNDYGYNPEYHTLQKDMVWWLTMYSFISTTDLSQWEWDGHKYYIAQYGTSTIIELALWLPSLEDTTKQETIKNNIQIFLKGLQFIPWYVVSSSQKLQMLYPSLQISLIKGLYTNIIDTTNNYIGEWWSYTTPFAVIPLKNEYENITYTLISNSVELWNTKTTQEKFDITTEKIPSTQKSLVTYAGHLWYIYCTEESTDAIHYDDYKTTKQWWRVSMWLCRLTLYVGDDEDTILQVDLNVEKSKLKIQQTKLLTTLKKTLFLTPIDDWETTLPTKIMKSINSAFIDTKDQTDQFNAYLNLLVSYGILPKISTLKLDTPMTYRSYLALYLKAVYNITEDKTDTVLKVAGINPDAYVDSSIQGLLSSLISLRMAGVQLPSYSSKDILKFKILSQSTYRSDWKKIEEFEYSIYGDTKYGLDKVLSSSLYDISYMAYNSYYFDMVWWLKKSIDYNERWSLSTPVFGTVSNASQQDMIIQCASKPMMDKKCMQFHKQLANTIVPTSSLWYEVLTLWDTLDWLDYSIDVWLFDTQWKAKKNN